MLELIENPERSLWSKLILRPRFEREDLLEKIRHIVQDVKTRGDAAIVDFTAQFDHVNLSKLEIPFNEIDQAEKVLDGTLKKAILQAKENIIRFHSLQRDAEIKVETMPGVTCWRKSVSIEKVGLYIPGGSAPLFSTVLMLAVPAKLAGCRQIVLCTPPDRNGKVHPAILYAAKVTGIDLIFKVGGAQAIAAMAVGTNSIPRVNKIFGPGNQYVTEAKMFVQQLGVAIDMPAGPSEVLVIADESANPTFIASDLLSQAEHGPDSQVILAATSKRIVDQTMAALSDQLAVLPRKEIAAKALAASRALLFSRLSDAVDFSNHYAPEHLILAVRDPHQITDSVTNAGSVFVGHFSPESVGDYASGTNHTLPTNGWARSYSGVSLESFLKKITFQELTPEGLVKIGPIVSVMAEAEFLEAHKRAVQVRLELIKS